MLVIEARAVVDRVASFKTVSMRAQKPLYVIHSVIRFDGFAARYSCNEATIRHGQETFSRPIGAGIAILGRATIPARFGTV